MKKKQEESHTTSNYYMGLEAHNQIKSILSCCRNTFLADTHTAIWIGWHLLISLFQSIDMKFDIINVNEHKYEQTIALQLFITS